MTQSTSSNSSSDWWQREKQRFLKKVLIALALFLALIGYFYYINSQGRIGYVHGVNFDTANYIAFVRREQDGSTALYAVRADGSDLRRLTSASDPSNKEHPAWTPDGKSLVYASNLKDSRTTQLYVLGDGNPVQLTYGSGNKFSPVVSPDGKLVAFVTQGVVKTVSITGSNVMQVMPPPRAGNEPEGLSFGEDQMAPYLSVAFAPDGQTLAGVQDISNVEIQLKNDSSAAARPDSDSKVKLLPIDQQVIVLPGDATKPFPPLAQGREVSMAWEPNGSRLATSYSEFPMLDAQRNPIDIDNKPLPPNKPPVPISEIRIWSFNGGKPQAQNFFASLGYGVAPKNVTWSPDGSKLAFELWRLEGEGVRSAAGLRVMDVSKEGKMIMPQDVPLIPYLVAAGPEGYPQNPHWSSDGSRLVYEMVKPNGKHDLWVINADGTNPINLTKGQGDNTDATWAPSK